MYIEITTNIKIDIYILLSLKSRLEEIGALYYIQFQLLNVLVFKR